MVKAVLSSYRTYEEWKHVSWRSKKGSTRWVLTVPMRNGNITSWTIMFIEIRFLPYLWGMETCFAGCHWYGSFCVLTVPMRNGNASTEYLLSSPSLVLTVPMRNGNCCPWLWLPSLSKFLPYLWGMETCFVNGKSTLYVSSYRTYEEWKRF